VSSEPAGPLLALLDYGMGNRRSVEKALEHVGARVIRTADHGTLRSADALVLPGVGAFPAAMRRIDAQHLGEVIRERVGAGIPLLGICLGMQLLFERSYEIEPTPGLGLLAGDVTRLDSRGARLPHIGWSDVHFERESALTGSGAAADRPFYHVHSFAVRPADRNDIVATAEYGERFATIVARDAVFGVQFHPEKSSADGLALLSNFVAYVARAAREPGIVTSA
jgi:imidazole glycerol-phosphate synthase subunit HisH